MPVQLMGAAITATPMSCMMYANACIEHTACILHFESSFVCCPQIALNQLVAPRAWHDLMAQRDAPSWLCVSGTRGRGKAGP